MGVLFVAGIVAVIFMIQSAPRMQAQETSMSTSSPTVDTTLQINKLSADEARVIINKGTEMPGSGKYENFDEAGTYTCKYCGAPLYKSTDKFDAHCGWPSFDDEIPGAVKRTRDADGMRTEITCARCGAHLGHVFTGEGFTEKNARHCVNSISLNFTPAGQPLPEMRPIADVQMVNDSKTDAPAKIMKAYFAGGCFWGVEYYMEKIPGVISVTSGYMGGTKPNPTYREVCDHGTGYAETVEVVYDPSKTDYEKIARTFFEIHDPTQMNRQGPDVGDQYRSEVFFVSYQQKEIAYKLIGLLNDNGYSVVTKVKPADTFWPAEDYHQDYYDHKGTTPYCHGFVDRFKKKS